MKFDTMCIHHPLKFQSSCPTLYCLVIIFLNGKRLDWHKTTISDNAFLSRRKIVFKLSGNVRLLDVPILINIGITFSTTTARGRHVSKKLDVKTFPFDSSTRGALKLQWAEEPSEQGALVSKGCPSLSRFCFI